MKTQPLTWSSKLIMVLSGVLLALLICLVGLVFVTKNIILLNKNGWLTVDSIGSSDADFFTRAVIAKIGLFANSKEKTLYFAALPDAKIDYQKLFAGPKYWFALDSRQHYQIVGNANLPAGWWNITAYNQDEFLVPNQEGQYSFLGQNLVVNESGDFVIDVASERPANAQNWLPIPKNAPFNLKLRVYEPAPQLYEQIASFPLPKLVSLGTLQSDAQKKQMLAGGRDE